MRPIDGEPQPPVTPSSSVSKPVKRPTRQWAAWTREEEENFFTALRLVGKNFENITCRVQSKNKDQVRHYYYRLVRRMNKLLGPALSLDAKNSKDTNAAMLRWWSLLEKYSCKASKLHLKPRRFKNFVEALEHQLMKDRKKNVKKRVIQGEIHSSPSPTTAANQNKLSGNDTQTVKILVVDSQNGQKAGHRRGYSRRNSSMGVIHSSNKGESSHTKQTRQHRKTAAMKRWEKAAIDGVSLVADAAEHLERTAGKIYSANQEQSDSGPSAQMQVNSSNLSKSIVVIEDNTQTTAKLKLQLFPIDESTRKALEMNKHNPHLELTLSTRKKIFSILEHLDRKWGTSSVACGELMIFPFNIQRENLLAYQKWTRDSVVTAGEVYAIIGSPTVFRLRYGWISRGELQSSSSGTISSNFDVLENGSKQSLQEQSLPPTEEKDKLHNLVDCIIGSHQTSDEENSTFKKLTAATSGKANMNVDVDLPNDVLGQNLGSSILSRTIEACAEDTPTDMRKVHQKVRKIPSLSTREWADTLTNVAAGDGLTEVSDVMNANCIDTPAFRNSQCLEEIPSSCDSFDAAIAAHISSHNKIGFSGPSPHLTSIWDAEETCDAFSFQNRAVSNNQAAAPSAGLLTRSSARTNVMVQISAEEFIAEDNLLDECPSETHETGSSAKDFSSLTDIYWPDSLGPLELDVPSCKYYSEDLILSDSLSGLNRLLASSLDAFQNCTFFGFDEKGHPPPATGGQGGASFAGKIFTSDNGALQSLQA